MAKTRTIELVSCNWFVLNDILLTNGDERNLILPKFSRPLYFFFSSALWHLQKLLVNDFAFYLATFSLQNVTSLIAGLDEKI